MTGISPVTSEMTKYWQDRCKQKRRKICYAIFHVMLGLQRDDQRRSFFNLFFVWAQARYAVANKLTPTTDTKLIYKTRNQKKFGLFPDPMWSVI